MFYYLLLPYIFYYLTYLIFFYCYSYKGGFVLYGGQQGDGTLSNELWMYEVMERRWSLRALSSTFRPPPLARHTLTLAHDGWIYIVGGSTEQGEFSSKIYRIKLSTGMSSLLIFIIIMMENNTPLFFSD